MNVLSFFSWNCFLTKLHSRYLTGTEPRIFRCAMLLRKDITFSENYWNGPTLSIKWKKLETNKIPLKMIKILIFGKIRWSKFLGLKLQFYINFFRGSYFFTLSIFNFFKNLIFSKFIFSNFWSKLIFFFLFKMFFFRILLFQNSNFLKFNFFNFYFFRILFSETSIFSNTNFLKTFFVKFQIRSLNF